MAGLETKTKPRHCIKKAWGTTFITSPDNGIIAIFCTPFSQDFITISRWAAPKTAPLLISSASWRTYDVPNLGSVHFMSSPLTIWPSYKAWASLSHCSYLYKDTNMNIQKLCVQNHIAKSQNLESKPDIMSTWASCFSSVLVCMCETYFRKTQKEGKFVFTF